jgi:hypothetical protein
MKKSDGTAMGGTAIQPSQVIDCRAAFIASREMPGLPTRTRGGVKL